MDRSPANSRVRQASPRWARPHIPVRVDPGSRNRGRPGGRPEGPSEQVLEGQFALKSVVIVEWAVGICRALTTVSSGPSPDRVSGRLNTEARRTPNLSFRTPLSGTKGNHPSP